MGRVLVLVLEFFVLKEIFMFSFFLEFLDRLIEGKFYCWLEGGKVGVVCRCRVFIEEWEDGIWMFRLGCF